MTAHLTAASTVFFITLAITYAASILARMRSKGDDSEEDLAGRKLNRWLVGLSAGTTGNSGFIVTGAVGLGYVGGVQWLLLPISWLIGDLVFWSLFPRRLNQLGREANATTISELLTFDIQGPLAKAIGVLVSILLVVFLCTYTSAQWLAGKKFLSGIFQISESTALIAFGFTIVLYSSLGGFRGSIYTDTVQAVIRILGTVIALAIVTTYVFQDQHAFLSNIAAAGPEFLSLAPSGSLITVGGFILGYAFAAIGFGLGQPQILSRYLAGASPEETQQAKWIYIGFLQGTWIAMTLFGILLRGVMPGIEDPETGLSQFFQLEVGPILTGIIFADVFATIASTSNGILVAISQTLRRELLGGILGRVRDSLLTSTVVTLALGLATIALSFVLPGNVFTIAIDSVSKIGAALAGPVMIKLFRWKNTGPSVLFAIIVGIASGFLWKHLGYGAVLNEAVIGIMASLVTNFLVALPAKKSRI